MTKSRGIRVRRGTRLQWVEQNQGKFFCQCGCGEPLPLKPEHFNIGVPRFLHGHNAKVVPPRGRKARIVSSGYIYVRAPEHPFSSPSWGRIMEHRLVLEEHLRLHEPESPLLTVVDGTLYLRPDVEVHHRDGDKQNNIVGNLEALTCAEHSRLHGIARGGLNRAAS
jgi:hypothetical protein